MTCVLSPASLDNNPCSSFEDKRPGVFDELNFQCVDSDTDQKIYVSGACKERPLTPSKMDLGENAGHETVTGNWSKVTGVSESTHVGSNITQTNPSDMCNQSSSEDDTNKCLRKGKKRKAEFEEFDEIFVPPKRISPFLNTPKEKKEERKKVLKISIQKLKHLEDPENFLRRSVLINNTMKRLQTEVREEKMKQPKYGRRNKAVDFSYGMLNNNCLSSSYMYDDPFLCNAHEKITDDMTDTLMSNLRDRLGDIPNGDTEVKQESQPEPEVMVQCENETNQSDLNTQSKCNQDSSSCALCSHCNNNNSCEIITKIDAKNVQSEYQTTTDIGETSYSKDFNFIVRGKLTDESSTCEKYDHFSNDVRTTYLTPNDNRLENVPESFINKTVLNCSNRLDLNMIIETEVMSHSDIKPSADYSRSPPHFQDGIYAY